MLIAIDLGGTKVQVAAADPGGRMVARELHPTPPGLDDGLALIAGLVRTIAAGRRITGVGVAIGGPIDAARGVVSPLHQPAWRQVPLGALIATWTGAPWRIEVDTDAAALAEHHRGGHRAGRLLYITVSTGVGGGFVIDGEVFRGAGGVHPEFAHQTVPGGEEAVCACGATGCLEALICGPALRRRHGCDPAQLDDAAWRDAGRLLGRGLRNAATLLAPEVVSLGGGVVSGAGERLLAPAREELTRGLRLVPAPRLVASPLGYDSALHGAWVLAALAAGADPAAWIPSSPS